MGESDCQELVKLLKAKSDKLRKEACKPEILKAIALRMMVHPGLGLVGENSNDKILDEIGKEAVDAVSELMDQYSTVDSFINKHAQTLKSLLDAGAEIDDQFVDALLDVPISTNDVNSSLLTCSTVSSDVSYTKSRQMDQ